MTNLCVQRGGDANQAGARLRAGKWGVRGDRDPPWSRERARSLHLSPVPRTQAYFCSDVPGSSKAAQAQNAERGYLLRI